jgi:hypothetical protein
MKRFGPILIFVLFLVLAGLACGGSSENEATDQPVSEEAGAQEVTAQENTATEPEASTDQAEPAAPESPTATPEPTSTPEPTPTPEPSPTPVMGLVSAGTHLVGTDIQPGIFKGVAGTGFFDSCYWERLSDLSGEFDAIIANDNATGQFYVEVRESDHALSTDCDLVELEHASLSDTSSGLSAGTYLVGSEIIPGIYQGLADVDPLGSCYWERLADVAGEFDSIVANDNAIGQFYVEILPSDFAFSIDCDLVSLDAAPSGEMVEILAPGTYLVGRDIMPGTYQGQAGTDIMESCYWERLSAVTGDFSSLIANDNATGQFYLQVSPGDFALSTDCELQRVGD